MLETERKPAEGLTVKSGGTYIRIPFSHLSYVEVIGKRLYFNLADGGRGARARRALRFGRSWREGRGAHQFPAGRRRRTCRVGAGRAGGQGARSAHACRRSRGEGPRLRHEICGFL